MTLAVDATNDARRRGSLSNDVDESPPNVETDASIGKKRRKSRGMMAIFGSGNTYEPDESLGSKSNLFPIRKKLSPVDSVLTSESTKPKKEKSKKKKLAGSKGRLSSDASTENVASKRSEGLYVPRAREGRRHSVSVVITAPPIATSLPANSETSTKSSHSRRRRRSYGITAMYDYGDAMMNALKFRHHLGADLSDADDVDDVSDNLGPYIRPPIVVVTASHRRKYSLQTDYDVREINPD